MTTEPDWVYGADSFAGWNDELVSDSVIQDVDFVGCLWYLGPTSLPVDSRWARRGIRVVAQQITLTGEPSAVIHIRWGLFGWYARYWLRSHPLQLTADVYRPEWGEWRTVSGTVHVE